MDRSIEQAVEAAKSVASARLGHCYSPPIDASRFLQYAQVSIAGENRVSVLVAFEVGSNQNVVTALVQVVRFSSPDGEYWLGAFSDMSTPSGTWSKVERAEPPTQIWTVDHELGKYPYLDIG